MEPLTPQRPSWPAGKPFGKPYTKIGVRRSKCIRCRRPGMFTWQICADGNRWRVLCMECDVQLNEMVLRWAGDPDADDKIFKYRNRIK